MVSDQVKIRPLVEQDLEAADRIMRLAFGTFLGLPDPVMFMGDASYVRSRWVRSPESAFAAELDGKLVGSNFVTLWGTFGFFGPLTLDPTFWGRGLASKLMEPVIDTLDKWKVSYAGLFTFAQSPKHLALYQKFGFWPRSLTVVLEKTIGTTDITPDGWFRYSQLGECDRSEVLSACQNLTGGIYPGLDLTSEIKSIEVQGLGDTILFGNPDLLGFATCHSGPGSEAGSGTCYLKFGAVKTSPRSREHFRGLLSACALYAGSIGATRMIAGVNVARQETYEELLMAGFRISLSGISMHRPNEPGFSTSGVFVVDDWR